MSQPPEDITRTRKNNIFLINTDEILSCVRSFCEMLTYLFIL